MATTGEEITSEGVKKFSGVAIIGLGSFACLVVAWLAFGDQISDAFNFRYTVEKLGDRMSGVEEASRSQSKDIAALKLTAIDFQDFVGDTEGELSRREKIISANTQSHIQQKERATVRIGEHKARDVVDLNLIAELSELKKRIRVIEDKILVLRMNDVTPAQ